MIDHEKILERITTIIGFSAVMLGLLVNAASNITPDNSTTITSGNFTTFNYSTLFAILLLLVTIFLSFNKYVNWTFSLY